MAAKKDTFRDHNIKLIQHILKFKNDRGDEEEGCTEQSFSSPAVGFRRLYYHPQRRSKIESGNNMAGKKREVPEG